MASESPGVVIPRWTVFEASFTSTADYPNALQDVTFTAEFASPSGRVQAAHGFWDGGRTWRVRFCPDEVGRWTLRTCATPESDAGLHGQSAAFECSPYRGRNPLFRHGPVRVSDDRRHLCRADGTPWFWLADTAWNGVLLSSPRDWAAYLKDRRAKGFTAIQYVSTPWLAAMGDAQGRPAWIGKERLTVDPVFFQRADDRVAALNAAGLVAAPVLLWAAVWNQYAIDMNPGFALPEDQAAVLARYMVARYGAHHVVWILGGDGDYRGDKAERWKRLGRAVFGDRPARPVTMHPCGQTWVADEFRQEPWFSFNGYQSGHGDSAEHLRWLTEGPPAREWRKEPPHPVINLEPNYEGHRAYHGRAFFGANEVRRAAWWSVLVSPPAGVTYGAHGVWAWHLRPQEPMNHPGCGAGLPWHEAMGFTGSEGMKHLKTFFDAIEWWRLRPAPDLLAKQPGAADPEKFIAAALAEDGSFAVAYLPTGGEVTVRTARLPKGVSALWFDPIRGECAETGAVGEPEQTFTAPGPGDWVLWLGVREK